MKKKPSSRGNFLLLRGGGKSKKDLVIRSRRLTESIHVLSTDKRKVLSASLLETRSKKERRGQESRLSGRGLIVTERKPLEAAKRKGQELTVDKGVFNASKRGFSRKPADGRLRRELKK